MRLESYKKHHLRSDFLGSHREEFSYEFSGGFPVVWESDSPLRCFQALDERFEMLDDRRAERIDAVVLPCAATAMSGFPSSINPGTPYGIPTVASGIIPGTISKTCTTMDLSSSSSLSRYFFHTSFFILSLKNNYPA